MRSKRFVGLFVALVERNKSFGLEFVDDEIVEFAVVISGVSDENSAFLLSVNADKFFKQGFGYFAVRAIVGKRDFDQRNSFAADQNMGSKTPEP